jgi:hypothetical protein
MFFLVLKYNIIFERMDFSPFHRGDDCPSGSQPGTIYRRMKEIFPAIINYLNKEHNCLLRDTIPGYGFDGYSQLPIDEGSFLALINEILHETI